MGRRFEPVWAHMNTDVKASILIPVFNGANYLDETIESILENTDPSIVEIIVINDGSLDETDEICLRYRKHIKYIVQENHGEFQAINNGLNKASGKYIMVVSHDDPMLSPNLIPEAIEILDTNLDIVCVYPDWQIINAEGEVIRQNVVKEYSEKELIGKFNCLPGPGAVFRKGAALQIGGRRKWKFVSDYDFWLRLSRVGRFKRIPGVKAQWRSHKNSTTVSMKSLKMADERILVIEDFLFRYPVHPKMFRMAKSSAYYFAARLSFFAPEIPAKKFLIVSFKSRKAWPEVANPIIVLFILTLPFSRNLLKLLIPFSKRLQEVF